MPLFGKNHNDATVANGDYDNTNTQPNHNFRHDVEGGALGGVAGHEYQKHHNGTGGPGAATGTAAGLFGGHEYNKHHNNTNAGYDGTNANQGNLRHDVEGGAAGGLAGHEYQKHHDGTGGPGVGTGVAVGALGGHEYNKHHHNNNTNGVTDPGMAGTNGVGTGMGTNAGMASGAGTGMGMGTTATRGQGLPAGRNDPIATQREARSLMRDGKIEKAVGTVLCSTTLKQKGLQKENNAAALMQQSQNIAVAENLEAQAAMHRGNAVGLGAHPQHAVAGGQNQAPLGTNAY